MAARLIINADDFGLTPGVNRAIGDLHAAGVLSSATLMANGEAFDDAVGVARRNPRMGIGCHIVLTDGTPVSEPERIPSLIGADGKSFRPSLPDFVHAVLRGKVRGEDIHREALAQVQKLQRAGIHVTHVDTHKHAHLFPAVAAPLLEVAERMSVSAVRNPFEQGWSLALSHGAGLRRLQVRLLGGLERSFRRQAAVRSGRVLTTDGTIGVSATGDLTATSLHEILHHLPDGVWELVCHPGYNDGDLQRVVTRLRQHRDVEREALLAVAPQALSRPGAPQLIHFGDLAKGDPRRETRAQIDPPASVIGI